MPERFVSQRDLWQSIQRADVKTLIDAVLDHAPPAKDSVERFRAILVDRLGNSLKGFTFFVRNIRGKELTAALWEANLVDAAEAAGYGPIDAGAEDESNFVDAVGAWLWRECERIQLGEIT